MNNNNDLEIILSDVLNIISYVRADLNSLITKIVPTKNSVGNCNFPITLFALSSLEYLGYLSSSQLIEEKRGTPYTQNRILSFIYNFFDEESKSLIKNNENDFVNIFRNGLAHEFYPKQLCGISRKNNSLLFQLNGLVVLDADQLSIKLIQALDKFENLILTNFNLRNRVIDRHYARMKPNLIKRGGIDMDYKAVRASGASISGVRLSDNYSTSSQTTTLLESLIDKNNAHEN